MFSCDFEVLRSIAHHRKSLQLFPQTSQQCGQFATHDGMFSNSPAMYFAAMANGNIQLIVSIHISNGRALRDWSLITGRGGYKTGGGGT